MFPLIFAIPRLEELWAIFVYLKMEDNKRVRSVGRCLTVPESKESKRCSPLFSTILPLRPDNIRKIRSYWRRFLLNSVRLKPLPRERTVDCISACVTGSQWVLSLSLIGAPHSNLLECYCGSPKTEYPLNLDYLGPSGLRCERLSWHEAIDEASHGVRFTRQPSPKSWQRTSSVSYPQKLSAIIIYSI